ncbi:MAG: undecaprenyl-diphosphatase, partial [Candidatus Levybacteria bacterium]|nr:undecaprenyl-diphosphatase [Candidatus Levybacteria bacterium]
FIGAFIVALLAVKFILKYIERNNFIPFGIYRIVVAILFFLFVLN